MSRHRCAAGAWFWSRSMSKYLTAKKIQHQKTHCFLSKHPQIALAWTWSRGALKGSRGWSGQCRGYFLFSGRQEPRLAGSWVDRELGPVRAACARQETAPAWMDTQGML